MLLVNIKVTELAKIHHLSLQLHELSIILRKLKVSTLQKDSRFRSRLPIHRTQHEQNQGKW